jgi:hypothetical protein
MAIRDGMAVKKTENKDPNSNSNPTKSEKKSMEKVIASTLQSMAGIGSVGYKNKTIYGRREKLETIGKVLNLLALDLLLLQRLLQVYYQGVHYLPLGEWP